MRMIDGEEGGCWSMPEATWLEGKGSLGLAAHLTLRRFVGERQCLRLALRSTPVQHPNKEKSITTSIEFVSPIHSLALLFPASNH